MRAVLVLGDDVVMFDEAALYRLRQLLAGEVNRLGDGAPDAYATTVEAIARHSSPSPAIVVDNAGPGLHGGLVSHTVAANLLDVSRRTISRMVAAGRLSTVGNLITPSSIEDLLSARPGSTSSYSASLRRDPLSRRQPEVMAPQGMARRRGERRA